MAEPATISSTTELPTLSALEHMIESGALPAESANALMQSLHTINDEETALIARRQFDDLFSGGPDSQARLFQLSQMALSGADNSMASVATPNSAKAKAEEEQSQRRSADRMWNALMAEQRINQLKREIDEIDQNIIVVTARRADILKAQAEHLEIKKELQPAYDEAMEQLPEVEAQHAQATQHGNELRGQLQGINHSLAQQKDYFDNLIRNSGLSQKGIEALDTLKTIGRELVVVKMEIPGDPMSPPPSRAVFKDERGGYYVEDDSGNRHEVTQPHLIRWIERQHNNPDNTKKFADHSDPATHQMLETLAENRKIYMEELSKLRPEIRNAILAGAKNLFDLTSQKYELQHALRNNGREIRELEEKIAKYKEDIRLYEDNEAELERLQKELEECDRELERLNNERALKVEELNTLQQKTDASLGHYQKITAFVNESESYKKYQNGEISFAEMYQQADPEIQQIFEDLNQVAASTNDINEAAYHFWRTNADLNYYTQVIADAEKIYFQEDSKLAAYSPEGYQLKQELFETKISGIWIDKQDGSVPEYKALFKDENGQLCVRDANGSYITLDTLLESGDISQQDINVARYVIETRGMEVLDSTNPADLAKYDDFQNKVSRFSEILQGDPALAESHFKIAQMIRASDIASYHINNLKETFGDYRDHINRINDEIALVEKKLELGPQQAEVYEELDRLKEARLNYWNQYKELSENLNDKQSLVHQTGSGGYNIDRAAGADVQPVTNRGQISTQRHADSGRLSQTFGAAAQPSAKDNHSLAHDFTQDQLEQSLISDTKLAEALRAENMSLDDLKKDPAKLEAFIHNLEAITENGDINYSNQITELHEMQERLNGDHDTLHAHNSPNPTLAPATATTL